MRALVVDASVALKWYVPEPGHRLADALLKQCGRDIILHAPSLIHAEMGNILWKKQRNGEVSIADCVEMLEDFLGSPVQIRPIEDLATQAFEVTSQTGRTFYDSLYLAFAADLGCKVVTADKRLVNGLAGTPWSEFVIDLAAWQP